MKQLFGILLVAGLLSAQQSFAQLDKNDRKLEKVYKKYKDNYRLGMLYMECGLVEEGKALLEAEKATGKCSACQEAIDKLLLQSKFSREINTKYNAAALDVFHDSSRVRARGELRALVAQNYALAAATLATDFEYNDHQANSQDSAMYYNEIAAVGGYNKSMFRLARYYHYGNGSEYLKCSADFTDRMNLSKAMFWYREAAAKGFADAIAKLGVIEKARDTSLFKRGYAAYTAGEYREAFDLWSVAAEGNQNATACFNIGCLCGNDKVKIIGSIADAEIWFRRAGDLGMAEGYASAAACYWAEGYGKMAMEYYQKAADMGYAKGAEKKRYIQDFLDAATSQRQREMQAYYDNMNKKANEQRTTTVSSAPVQDNKKIGSWCSACAGSGKIHTTVYGGTKGPNGSTVFGEYTTCTACGGKGSR